MKMDDFKDLFIGHQPGTREVICQECEDSFEKWFPRPKLAQGPHICESCRKAKLKEIVDGIDWEPSNDD